MFPNGSEAAKVDPLERMADLSQEAELNRACPSVLICSQFGQWRIFRNGENPYQVRSRSPKTKLNTSESGPVQRRQGQE
jgi:hypothetical protein